MDLHYYNLWSHDFMRIQMLSDLVNGKDAVSFASLEEALRRGIDQGLNCNYVVYDKSPDQNKLVGFRLTYAPGMWEPTKYHSPDKWKVDPIRVCRFNSVAVHPDYRLRGIGRQLMEKSIETAKQLGAKAGVTHVWMESPDNSAYEYWARLGGELVRIWPNKWAEEYKERKVICAADGENCACTGAEMILYFRETDPEAKVNYIPIKGGPIGPYKG